MENKHVTLICFIADPFDPIGCNRIGGGHIYLFDLCRYLIQQKYKVTYITRNNNVNKPYKEALGGYFTIYRIVCGPQREISPDEVGMYLEQLKDKTIMLLNSLSPISIIHSHYWIAGSVVMDYCKKHYIRHIHTVLSIGKVKQELGEPISIIDDIRNKNEAAVYQSADALLLICPDEKNNFIKYYPNIDKTKLFIIPNGINTDIFYPRISTSDNYFCRSTNRFKERIKAIF